MTLIHILKKTTGISFFLISVTFHWNYSGFQVRQDPARSPKLRYDEPIHF